MGDGGGDMGGSAGFGSIGDFGGGLGLGGNEMDGFPGFGTAGNENDNGGFSTGIADYGGFGPEGSFANENDNGGFSTGLGGFGTLGGNNSGVGGNGLMSAIMSFLGKNALGKGMNALGIPGPIAGILSSIMGGKSPGQAVSSGFGSTLGGVLGSAFGGPLGGFLGSQAGSAFGGAMNGPNAGQGMGPGNNNGSSPGGWGDLLSGGLGLWNASQLSKLGQPNAGQAGANANIAALMANPNSITSMPGWKAGEQAVTRSMAANGYLGSGNMMKALQDYGGDFYNKTLQTMSGLGAPTAGQTEYNIGGTQLQGQALNRLLYGLGNLNGG